MLLGPEDFESQKALEDAGFEELRLYLTQVRRQIWDEEQFKSKLCYRTKSATFDRSSLASFLSGIHRRKSQLERLEHRLQGLIDERLRLSKDPS